MRELEFINNGEPVLVRTVLKEYFGFSKGTVTSLKLYGEMFVNGEKVTVRREMKKGDVLTVKIKDKVSENIVPVQMELDIVYEDDDILAVNKPAGISTHPSLNHYTDTLANGVAFLYKDRNFIFRAVNRLDRETSGLVLIAKNRNSAHKLGEQLKTGEISKTYYALCEGNFSERVGSVCAPIARECESMILRCVRDDGKYALTEYKVLKEYEDCTLLEVNPKTGRTHQIRVHMSHIGHPIKNDYLYGNESKGEKLRLHCGKMCFKHPVTNEFTELLAKMPDYFFEEKI